MSLTRLKGLSKYPSALNPAIPINNCPNPPRTSPKRSNPFLSLLPNTFANPLNTASVDLYAILNAHLNILPKDFTNTTSLSVFVGFAIHLRTVCVITNLVANEIIPANGPNIFSNHPSCFFSFLTTSLATLSFSFFPKDSDLASDF